MKDSSFHSASTSTVSAFTTTKFAKLKEKITKLKAILDEQAQASNSDIDEFAIHQQLDDSELYVKMIPKDNNNVFRAFSDALTFSQAKLLYFKKHLIKYCTKYPNQLNKLLESVSDETIPADEYLLGLKKGSVDQEIEMLLLCEIHKCNMSLLYYGKDLKLQEEFFDLGFDRRRSIRVCHFNDNKFDTVYEGKFMQVAALCQSVIYSCFDKAIQGE